MPTSAKVFTSGNSQAIRLPKAYRVSTREVWISKNDVTGEITLKPKESEDQRQRNLAALFQLIADNPSSEDFIPPRSGDTPYNPVEEDEAPAPPPSSGDWA
jgi:antitoxin VapB